jgi:hypothetical protein
MTELSWRAKDVGTIADFLTAAECDEYIAFGESTGFDEAPMSTGRGMVIIDDVERAQALYRKLSSHLPPRFDKKWQPVGLNERLRLYRYDAGQQFDWHLDGYFERPTGERSFFTFMVYLNDDFEGGATSFRNNKHDPSIGDGFRVTPRKGMALLFHHPIEHRGDPVIAGRKYVLRTDVMYGRWLRIQN